MFVWLKRGAEEVLDPNGQLVKIHRTGAKYFDLYGGASEIIVEVPNLIPQEFIERVTIKETILQGFCLEGVYRYNGATLVLRNSIFFSGEGNIKCQEIVAGAPTISALADIYTLVRQGRLTPEENWEGHITDIPPTQKLDEAVEKAPV